MDDDKKKIEETMTFKVAEEGFELLCRTREVGLEGRKKRLCEEDREKQNACKFANGFGRCSSQPYGYFCTFQCDCILPQGWRIRGAPRPQGGGIFNGHYQSIPTIPDIPRVTEDMHD